MPEILTLDARGHILIGSICKLSLDKTSFPVLSIGRIYRCDHSVGSGFIVGRCDRGFSFAFVCACRD